MADDRTIEDRLDALERDLAELKQFRRQVDDTVKEWPGLTDKLAEHGIRLKREEPAEPADTAGSEQPAEESQKLP